MSYHDEDFTLSLDLIIENAVLRPLARCPGLKPFANIKGKPWASSRKLDKGALSDFHIIWKTRYLTAAFAGFEPKTSLSAIVLAYTLYAQARVYCQDFLRNGSSGQRSFPLRHPGLTLIRKVE